MCGGGLQLADEVIMGRHVFKGVFLMRKGCEVEALQVSKPLLSPLLCFLKAAQLSSLSASDFSVFKGRGCLLHESEILGRQWQSMNNGVELDPDNIHLKLKRAAALGEQTQHCSPSHPMMHATMQFVHGGDCFYIVEYSVDRPVRMPVADLSRQPRCLSAVAILSLFCQRHGDETHWLASVVFDANMM